MTRQKIFLVSDFPELDMPTSYTWIKTRVDVLKEYYNVTVIKILDTADRNEVIRVPQEGFCLLIIKVRKLRVPKLWHYYRDFQLKRILLNLLKEQKPDLVHIHFSIYYSWVLDSVCRKLNIPYCITEHASFFETSMKRRFFGPRTRKALNHANRVFAVSEALKKIMLRYVNREIDVKFNIVDPDLFRPDEEERQAKRNGSRFITVGSLDENDKKGYELLIESLWMIKQRSPELEFQCDIIGSGPNRSKLEAMVQKYKLQPNVKFLGDIPNHEMARYYNQADFFVSSSRSETFGVAAVEAMCCGLPVVTTISGGPEEFVTEKEGIIVGKASAEAISEGIQRMIVNCPHYDRKHIRSYINNLFSRDKYLEYMKRVYDRLIEKHS